MKSEKKVVARRVTAKHIAQELGISVMTVSRALNDSDNVHEETRRKVKEAAQRLCYTPNSIAKSLVLQRTHTIGVIVPEITHSFFPEAIRGIEEVTNAFGYHLILMHSAEDGKREMEALMNLESKRVDGILISRAEHVRDEQVYSMLLDAGVPIVFFDRTMPGIGASCVGIDDRSSACKATEHLIGHGYRRLGHLSGPLSISIGRLRQQGFLDACHEHGINVPPECIIEAGFHEDGGFEAMKTLLRLPRNRRPRAVVAVNDPAAYGAMKAAEEAGVRIPGDIALVGFSDDIRASLMPVPLTTVQQPAYEVGRRAAQKLFSRIADGREEAEEIFVETRLVIRRSCGCTTATPFFSS